MNKPSTIKFSPAYSHFKGSLNRYQIYLRAVRLWFVLQDTCTLPKSACRIRDAQSTRVVGSWAGVTWCIRLGFREVLQLPAQAQGAAVPGVASGRSEQKATHEYKLCGSRKLILN